MEIEIPKIINKNNVLFITRLPKNAVIFELASAIYVYDKKAHMEKAVRMWYELLSLAKEAISRGINVRDPETLAKLLVGLLVDLSI